VARIRSVKPELRRDLTVAEWPREVRYAWVLLWGYLDDYGRGHDDMRLVCSDLFPLDRDVTDRKMDRWLTLMASTSVAPGKPVLCRYIVDGRGYLHAPKWDRSQRVSHPQPSLIPACPVHESLPNGSGTIPEAIPNNSGAAPESFRPSRAGEVKGLGVKGARGQGSKGPFGNPADARPPDASTVVAAYVEAVRQAGGILDNRAKGRIAKDAASLLKDGAPPDVLIEAAQRLGANGFADLGNEARRLHAERNGIGPRPKSHVEQGDEFLRQSMLRAQQAEASGITPFRAITGGKP